MDPSTILACVVAGGMALSFFAGWGACFLWKDEQVSRRDDRIAAVERALEREEQEATVAADSRRDMAAQDRARADVLAAPDRIKRVRDALAARKPAPAPAPPSADAGAVRQPRRVG